MSAAVDEIMQLYTSYARGLDQRDFVRARAICHPDAVAAGSFASGSIDQYFPVIERKVLEYESTMHNVGTTDVRLDGDGREAQADSYTVAHHLAPVGGGAPWILAVCYADRLERREGVWRVADRRVSKFWERWSL